MLTRQKLPFYWSRIIVQFMFSLIIVIAYLSNMLSMDHSVSLWDNYVSLSAVWTLDNHTRVKLPYLCLCLSLRTTKVTWALHCADRRQSRGADIKTVTNPHDGILNKGSLLICHFWTAGHSALHCNEWPAKYYGSEKYDPSMMRGWGQTLKPTEELRTVYKGGDVFLEYWIIFFTNSSLWASAYLSSWLVQELWS